MSRSLSALLLLLLLAGVYLEHCKRARSSLLLHMRGVWNVVYYWLVDTTFRKALDS